MSENTTTPEPQSLGVDDLRAIFASALGVPIVDGFVVCAEVVTEQGVRGVAHISASDLSGWSAIGMMKVCMAEIEDDLRFSGN